MQAVALIILKLLSRLSASFSGPFPAVTLPRYHSTLQWHPAMAPRPLHPAMSNPPKWFVARPPYWEVRTPIAIAIWGISNLSIHSTTKKNQTVMEAIPSFKPLFCTHNTYGGKNQRKICSESFTQSFSSASSISKPEGVCRESSSGVSGPIASPKVPKAS